MRVALAALVVAGVLGGAADLEAQLDAPIPAGSVREGTLSFQGHATAGDFGGTTTEISGAMAGGDDLSAVRGWVEAPVRTLVTGNGRRDRDLNKSLESDRFPTIRFDLSGVSSVGGSGDSMAVNLLGRLTIHGISREVTLPGSVRRSGDAVQVTSEFPLNLKDYEIGGLSKMLGMLKMYEDIEVRVDLKFGPSQ
ncbi:MAG: YceI family protein [Gemmatimonadales bacterium]|nr:YceI family protein [Gemmatimonadales bacterium]